MATIEEEETSHLTPKQLGSYQSINSPTSPVASIQDTTKGNALQRQWRELTSGKQRLSLVLLYSCIAAMGSCQMGFALGYSSLAQTDLTDKISSAAVPRDSYFKYIGGILNIGALISGLATGFLSDKFGRKAMLIVACVPTVLGWFLIAASWYFIRGDNYVPVLSLLLIGRFFTGVGAGCFSLVVPVYIIEIAPANLKGLFGAINQLSVTIGILAIYILTTFLHYYIVALVAMGFGLLYVIAVLFLPETPRWLMANSERLHANQVLYRLRGPKANIVTEMTTLEKGIESESEFTFVQKLNMLKRKSSFIPLILAIFLMFFQQFCGINVVIFYAGTVLKSAAVSKPDLKADFGVGVIQVIATFVSVLLVDVLGRRILLVCGAILLSLSSIVLGIYYYLHLHNVHNLAQNNDFSYLAVVCLAIFIIGFSIGWGPIPWLMMGELAPLQIRGLVSGIATAVNWSFSTIVTTAFDPYERLVRPYGAWGTFGVISAISIIFVFFFLPETRGKDLEDIQEYFQKRYGRDTSRREEEEDTKQ